MAHTGIYVTLLELTYKAGLNVNPTAITEAFANSFIEQAESAINDKARKVFAADITAFTALPNTTKKLLTEAASNLAAIYAINYDISGFTTIEEAIIMMTTLRDNFMRAIGTLTDIDNQKFLTTSTSSW